MSMTRLVTLLALAGVAAAFVTRPAGTRRPREDAGDDPVNRDAEVDDEALATSPNAGERLAPASRAGSALRRDGAHADLLSSNARDGAFATSSGLSDFSRGA